MRKSSTSARVHQITAVQKEANNIDSGSAKLQDNGTRFLYHPAQNIRSKSTSEYNQLLNTMNKPIYEKEEIVFDQDTKTYKLVKESEMYKYQS